MIPVREEQNIDICTPNSTSCNSDLFQMKNIINSDGEISIVMADLSQIMSLNHGTTII